MADSDYSRRNISHATLQMDPIPPALVVLTGTPRHLSYQCQAMSRMFDIRWALSQSCIRCYLLCHEGLTICKVFVVCDWCRCKFCDFNQLLKYLKSCCLKFYIRLQCWPHALRRLWYFSACIGAIVDVRLGSCVKRRSKSFGTPLLSDQSGRCEPGVTSNVRRLVSRPFDTQKSPVVLKRAL